jgi:hypothetical protein
MESFIPEIWSANILVSIQKSAVYAALANRDYEGEISAYGDTVHVNTAADATVSDYDPNAATPVSFDGLSTSSTPLLIDQAKYFAFKSQDIDAAQVRDNGQLITKQSSSSASKLRIAADTFLAGKLVAAVPAANDLGEVTLAEAADVYDMLVDMGVKLDDSDVPADGRVVVITPALHGLLQKDARFIATGDAAAEQVRTNGLVGRAAGMTIAVSTNVPGGNEIVCGQIGRALSFAEQIVSTEAIRLENDFATGIRGLHVYGGEVFEAQVLAGATVTVG